jgi:hypothetical protein
MQCLEVSCAVQPIYGSLGAKGLNCLLHAKNSFLTVVLSTGCSCIIFTHSTTHTFGTACILPHMFTSLECMQDILSSEVNSWELLDIHGTCTWHFLLMTKTFLVYFREIIKKRGEDKKNKKMCVCVRERLQRCITV